ncbi:hypothetical protein POM88_038749 [Heracleum sosnowskyi]|uniref:Ubiquitin-like protease family profile domain-containing protein n=1 Tax=Heracleum sosnowskyi TaxID=360622 RepID=A0AAD8HB04_9APIA|nr:hypothetical protein POM88_038749 [Heracleum sosnowskyi]
MAEKDKFFEDLKEAKEKYGDDVYLLSIEQVMNEVFHPSTTNGGELVVMNEQEQNPSTTNKYVCQVASDFELRPEDIEQLEIMEYLNSTQARIDMPDIFGIEGKNSPEKKLEDIPSFSLGIENNVITQVCNDIEKVETAGAIEEDAQDVDGEDDDDFVSPIPIVRGKSRRLVKVGRYAKSPYIERVIDLSAKYTNQDLGIWIYMIQKINILDPIFSWKGLTCIREHMQTLKMSTTLFYSVIDTWSIILNDNENYKAEESPMRFFCPIGSLHSGLNVDMNVTESYSIFAENMGYILNRYERNLDNIDMVFFPINKHGHFYIICYNLKKEACDVIDNIRHKNPKHCYGRTPNILHSHFTRYLKENGLVNLAKRMQKLQPSFLEMPWQSKSNSTDCGIFVMRHMETYKGDLRNWDTRFTEEGRIQDNQIIRLRVKYNNSILSSNLNEMKDEIQNQAKQLFNKGAEKRLMDMVAQVSAAKSSNAQNNKGKGAKRKTVTFAANLARSFDEADT